jgi:CRP-like cAMP-binding protein
MVESSALQKHSLFGGLLTEQIDRIRCLMTEESYESGDVIILEGSVNDKIRFITDGRVSIVKQGTILFELTEGETFGEMEVLDVMPTAAAIKALEATTVISLSNRDLREIYKTDIKAFAIIVMNLARDLSRRLRRMDDRVLAK